MPMIPNVKAEWVRRLLDPEAEQGHDLLRNEVGGQCCLDFLNQMCSDAGYQPQPVQLEDLHWGYEDPDADPAYLEDELQVSVLTQACIEYAGLEDTDPEVPYLDGKYRLSYLNDVMRLALPQIAELIRDSDL